MEQYIAFLKKYVDEKRVRHSEATANEAVRLARIYGADEQKAYTAGLLHDVAKGKCKYGLIKLALECGVEIDEIEKANPELIHGKLGARLVSEHLGIHDEDILNAIKWHTTGRENMSLLEKIVYLADLTEPGRDFENIEYIRTLAEKNINGAMIYSLKCEIEFIKRKGFALHPKSAQSLEFLLQEEENKLGLQ